jgi:hypothetical protein
VAQPLQSREHTRTRLARQQSGEDIDMGEAQRRANNGDYSLIDKRFAQALPPEEALQRMWRGY